MRSGTVSMFGIGRRRYCGEQMHKRNNTLWFELADNSENGLDVICDKSLPTQGRR